MLVFVTENDVNFCIASLLEAVILYNIQNHYFVTLNQHLRIFWLLSSAYFLGSADSAKIYVCGIYCAIMVKVAKAVGRHISIKRRVVE